MIEPAPGVILISEPFLKDPNFMRTAVYLCEHSEDSSFGLVMNRPFEQQLDDFIPALDGMAIPLFYGGPVQTDTLHILHTLPDAIPNATQVSNGVYWGGDFPSIIDLIVAQQLDLDRIRFYLGYSGWGTGQLEGEIAEKSWLTVAGGPSLVFHPEPEDIWKMAVQQLDKSFHPIIHYPIDPQLN
ncbi:MAG: YqgE/AlgH family protein [Bacteroidetes bacterium]|uniref:YqgE/AlgH family protein n=1 Tax=Phnomibacter sp. TaxID=2836217 RepID=UPI002FDD81E2|nr:YqgE/AlgH family protein [Bacteroidota bacterium]